MMLLMIQIMKMWEIMILITFPLKSTSARLVSRSAPDSSRDPEFCPQNWTEPELWLVTAKQNMKFWWLWRTLCRQLCRSLCPSWITAAALLAVYSRAGREWASPARTTLRRWIRTKWRSPASPSLWFCFMVTDTSQTRRECSVGKHTTQSPCFYLYH